MSTVEASAFASVRDEIAAIWENHTQNATYERVQRAHELLPVNNGVYTTVAHLPMVEREVIVGTHRRPELAQKHTTRLALHQDEDGAFLIRTSGFKNDHNREIQPVGISFTRSEKVIGASDGEPVDGFVVVVPVADNPQFAGWRGGEMINLTDTSPVFAKDFLCGCLRTLEKRAGIIED